MFAESAVLDYILICIDIILYKMFAESAAISM